ncbi:MAG: SIMPL domain-containing protein [Gammaproteobacteria bacterium]|nr:SIMPL domain-containing protein [Gammaproteobacteria bacterium]MBU2057317.1 SIMPL domain-containing protein [Gammaproteobacteria bacterium]MBU2174919.1 SIMPL domain-containing protein [Gammaproteobacteria bacterium]MBU2245524.1 SIMPL domain-containing protein [Gammaproteobacteria bacterium]MBU2344442.1 SIMPL domain-containing protein [Gammaproteobacteria bacterium]
MVQSRSWVSATILALALVAGSAILANSLIQFRAMERVVQVKGLAEREVAADRVIWPIKFNDVDNNLTTLVANVERKNEQIQAFLKLQGFGLNEISVAVPQIVDRQAGYYDPNANQMRYTASSIVTVYSSNVDLVHQAMAKLLELSKTGIAIAGQDYDSKAEFIFSGLNELKPNMIEEATRNAREVATKFAADSQSKLGKIKTASQGQFSISDRDSNTPYIKKVRVVATVDYYLSD